MLSSNQLSADYPDKSYGGKQVYADMLEQAVLCDELGFDAVSITGRLAWPGSGWPSTGMCLADWKVDRTGMACHTEV